MAGPGRGSPGRVSSPCGAVGPARIFPLAAAGKLSPGRKRWRDGPTGRGRAASFGIFCSSLYPRLLIPAPGTGSCCSRPDPRLPAPLWSLTSPFSGAGAASRRSRERRGHGEDCAGPAGVRWVQGQASWAPRSGLRRDPAPSRARAAAREPVPVLSGRSPSTPGDVRRGSRYVAAAAAAASPPFRRMILEADAVRPWAGRARGRCGDQGEGGASTPRAARVSHTTPATWPVRRATHLLLSFPCCSSTQAISPPMTYYFPLNLTAVGGQRF